MFEKILYPTDFSEVSKKALDYIKQLKGAGTQEVFVLHVIDQREIENVRQHAERAFGIEEQLEKIMEKRAQEETRTLEAELKERGFNIRVMIVRGIPLREILNIEENEDVSVIVIGSHGKSNIEEMLLGSVSEKVIRKCKKPVLVIKR